MVRPISPINSLEDFISEKQMVFFFFKEKCSGVSPCKLETGH